MGLQRVRHDLVTKQQQNLKNHTERKSKLWTYLKKKKKKESVSPSVVSGSLQPPEACQAPLSMGFPRQEYWSGLPCCPLGDLPNPGTDTFL